MASLTDELEIRIHRVANPGQDFISGCDAMRRQAGGFRKPDPLFDTARLVLDTAWLAVDAVVVHNSLSPVAPEFGIVGAGKNDRVLHRYLFLIVVAIQSPCLKLATCQLAGVHQQVKRVLMVIAFMAYGNQALAQFTERQQVIGSFSQS